jgi:DNA invertase Pin-like site-specific DNA recombinase
MKPQPVEITERTREGMAIARAKGRLRGRQPKLSAKQQAELRRMHKSGDYSITDLAELFSISRPTVYRTLRGTHNAPNSAEDLPPNSFEGHSVLGAKGSVHNGVS